MEQKKNILTPEGLKKLENEIHDLKVNKRKEVAQKIKEATAQGDLSENAEYEAAKEEQREMEARIAELDEILKNAVILTESEVSTEKVNIGCKVLLEDCQTGEELEYGIVGALQVDLKRHRISNESPVGAALVGAGVGETVSVECPAGILKFKVKKIDRLDQEGEE